VYGAGLAAENRTELQVEDLRRPLLVMRRILAGMREPTFPEDLLNELVRADIKFHLEIVEIAGNSWLKQEVMRLRVLHRVIATALKSKPIHTLDEHRRVQACHEEIFDAIVRGDSAAAKEAMDRHLQGNPLRFRR
ncbi:MAG: GntR family transcriptional regulator, partial [Verrucomicrobia bacterium]|nr:GntR family transcriptional regulator [Verrucomicrobiota bacterium]